MALDWPCLAAHPLPKPISVARGPVAATDQAADTHACRSWETALTADPIGMTGTETGAGVKEVVTEERKRRPPERGRREFLEVQRDMFIIGPTGNYNRVPPRRDPAWQCGVVVRSMATDRGLQVRAPAPPLSVWASVGQGHNDSTHFLRRPGVEDRGESL